jgi:hypothetical protein
MKLARANLFIVCNDVGLFIVRNDVGDHAGPCRGQSGSNVSLQSKSVLPRRTSRPSGNLVARWHCSPESGRIECRWLLEKPPADDYLCAGYSRTARRMRPSSRQRWRLIRPVTNLSQVP